MTDHPITPPHELAVRLRSEAPHGVGDAGVTRERYLIAAAYRAGADAELEACCELLKQKGVPAWSLLRLYRRPKPPGLKEQALAVISNSVICDHLTPEHEAILRRALEQLDG